MSDKRTVSTDALETLGTIIGEGAGRDAIHLAVEPVVAGENLSVGQDVGIDSKGLATPFVPKLVGIVDPFLKYPVKKGEKFWLIVYPRQITSLRHVWSHPDFPKEKFTSPINDELDKFPFSVKWITEFAGKLGYTYDRLMDYASSYKNYEEYTWDNTEAYKNYWDQFPEFWEHYEIVTGETVKDKSSFFTCGC